MTIPAFEEFIRPVLEEIAKAGKPILSVRKALISVVADRFKLTDTERSERLTGGQTRVANRVAWSITYLSKAGLIVQPKRGVAVITEAGSQLPKDHNGGKITKDDLLKYPSFKAFYRGYDKDSSGKSRAPIAPTPLESESPEERIQHAVEEIRAKVADDLRSALIAIDPTDFEYLVLSLMQGLGYGDQQGDFTHTGGSDDFGIDGIIRSDRIGLERIYLQAKRWQGPVGRKEIQAFYGSLAGLKATKGVFITTSRFTDEALEYASNVSSTLILIDCGRLVELMIEACVRVRVKGLVKIPEFDADYFE